MNVRYWFKKLGPLNKFFVISGSASILALISGFFFWYFPRPPLLSTSDKTSTVQQNGTETERTQTHISLDDVLETLAAHGLTDLQKSQFMARNQGSRVQWKGVVQKVTRAYEDPASYIILVFSSPSQTGEPFPALLTAEFPPSAERDLAALSRNDTVLLEGTLQFNQLGNTISLTNATLLTFTKSKNPGVQQGTPTDGPSSRR